MAVTYAENNEELTGTSGDTKPTNVLVNTLFLELDTLDFYYFDGTDWQKCGGAS